MAEIGSDYQQYRREIEGDRMARSTRAGCTVVALLSTGFIPIDFFTFRELFLPMLAFRLFCNAVMVLIIARTARSHPLESAVVGCLTTGAMLLTVIDAAGGVASEYTPGLMLLFLGIPVLLPLTANQGALVVGSLTAALASLPAVSGAAFDLQSYSVHLAFPFVAGIECVAACALLDRMRFADFLGRREIEKARDDLKELDREKSRFTANVHHELRTPLTLMLAPVDALIDGVFGEIDELARSYLTSIRSNGHRLLSLINDLLDLAKIEGRKLAIQKRRINLGGIVESFVAGARPLAARRDINIEVSGFDCLPTVYMDEDAIQKIITNLMGNALKFSDEGGKISIAGEQSGENGVMISIRDHGVGLPPDQLEKIFDRFAQIDSSNTRKYEGTGIGLALVRELVALHDGRVWAESDGLGHGTTMRVLLPQGEPEGDHRDEYLLDDATDGAIETDLDAKIHGGTNGSGGIGQWNLAFAEVERNIVRNDQQGRANVEDRTLIAGDRASVLVVEDNSDMRRLLADLLGNEFDTYVAQDGREGLERVREIRPDLVVTDVMMPAISGTELCGIIKGDSELCSTPVILVTSKAEREMKIQGLEMGADDYVTKPFHPRELMARVRSLVRVRRLQATLATQNARLESSNAELQWTLSELKEAGSALVQSERLAAVGELAAGVAHEVNNPVNFAMNALRTLESYVEDIRSVALSIDEVMRRDGSEIQLGFESIERLMDDLAFSETTESLKELVGIANDGLERTHRLVSDLKEFSAPSRSRDGTFDVKNAIESTIQLVRYSLREKGITLHASLDAELPVVRGNGQAMNQVILNLLKNAIEAVENSRGEIWVSARSAGSRIEVEVCDNGPGIRTEDYDRLFEPFFSTKAAGKGTGLGLSISRRIVEEHGGTIEAFNGEVGGSQFVVNIPAVVMEEELSDETNS